MYETLPLIQKLATERFELYRLAGKQSLTPAEQQRLDEINARLPVLWHQHRVEVAANHWSRPKATRLEPQMWDQAA